MKKIIIVSASILALIVLGYFAYSNLISQANPCAKIFEQAVISLEGKIDILKEKGQLILGREGIQELSDQSEQISEDLKTCCILFNEDKIVFEEFLKCQDEFNQYERIIDRVNNLVDEAETAKEQERNDLVNLRLKHIERNVIDLQRISGHLQVQMKSLTGRRAKEYKKPGTVERKSVITETEPNDSYIQGMEIPIGVLNGALSGDDRQDYFRFELGAGDVLNLDFTAGDESENLKIALRNFEGNDLWISGETASGVTKSTRMMMNNTSGGIYYAAVYSGIGTYQLNLFIESQNDGGSGTDAGDRITKALNIKPGRFYFGELGGVDENDWYRFDIPAGHILRLAFMPNESAEPMKFSLRSFERSEIWYSGMVAPGAKRPKRVMMNNSSGGTYYLEASYGSGQYEFEIFIENQNDAGSQSDAGDKISEALKVEPGRSYSGELGGYDETDWYRFDIHSGSILKIALTTYEDGEPIKFSFRDAKRNEVWITEDMLPGDTESTRVIINNSSGGTYFLEAFDGSGPYGFEVLMESQNDGGSGTDAGDIITEALKIKQGRSINGELGGLDKEDWYTFSPQEGKAIQFTSNKDGEPLKLSIGNVARRKVLYTAELTPGITKTFEIPRDVQPPYFLKVYGGSSKYSFEIK
jgi:hypothetical protein